MTFVRIWRFDVSPGRDAEFRSAYGPDGDWARLFRRAEGYQGTELLASVDQSNVFLTIDRWNSAASWEAFVREWRREYDALDHACAALTDGENDLGTFVELPEE